jgi:hypothetical protein
MKKIVIAFQLMSDVLVFLLSGRFAISNRVI